MVSFLREMDILKKVESCIVETQKHFMLKRKAVEKLSPQDNINVIIPHGLRSDERKVQICGKQKGGTEVSVA